MKKCPKCNELKKLGEFSKDKSREDELQYACKKCQAEYQRNYRHSENGKKSKKRYAESKNGKKRHKKYQQSSKGKRAQKKYKQLNSEKIKARRTLNREVKLGNIIKPDVCSKCNLECIPEGHHADYSKPLVVIWICKKCHKQLHTELT